jgi:Zn-dependent protease with chaperone function
MPLRKLKPRSRRERRSKRRPFSIPWLGLTQARSGTPDPALAERLEQRWRKIYRRQAVLYLLLIAAGVGLLWWQAVRGAFHAHPLVAAICLGYAAAQVVAGYAGLILGSRVALDRADEQRLGKRFSIQDIRCIVRETSEAFSEARELPNIYLIESKEGNAKVANSLLLNFIRPLNALYMNTYLLHALSREELRAVIAHEMAHFYRYMSPYARHRIGMYLFIGAATFEFMLHVPSEITTGWFSWIGAPIAVYVANKVAIYVVILTAIGGDDESEFLSDYSAASRFGALATINALLKLYLRFHVYIDLLETVAEVLETNTEKSFDDLFRAAEQVLPHTVITPEEAQPLLRRALSDEHGDTSIFAKQFNGQEVFENRRKKARELRAEIEGLRARKRIRWLDFDTPVRDGRLDEKECAALIQVLDDEPATKDKQWDSHPELSLRIRFLAATLPLNAD